MQENVEFCPKSTFRKSRKVNFAKSSMYLCDLCSNMCNRSFQPGLNPSSATLFSTSSRTTGATPLQKAAPLVRSNRLKPCCNRGFNPWFKPCCTLVSNPVANKKTPGFTLGVRKLWVGTVVHTRWNGRCKITTRLIPDMRCLFPDVQPCLPTQILNSSVVIDS